MLYQQLANLVLLIHALIVVFVIGALPLIVVGNLRGWWWINALLFRALHLFAILVVMAEALLGVVCPLTSLEMWLRTRDGETTYSGGFIEHWLQSFLYYQAPPWVFTVAYSVFAALVAGTWLYFPPRRKRDTL